VRVDDAARYAAWCARVAVHYGRDNRARKFRRAVIEAEGDAFCRELRWLEYCEGVAPREFVRGMRPPRGGA